MMVQLDFTAGMSTFLPVSLFTKYHTVETDINFGDTEVVLFVEMCFRLIFQIP